MEVGRRSRGLVDGELKSVQEPFVYKYVLKRVGDVDRALQADWLLEHTEDIQV